MSTGNVNLGGAQEKFEKPIAEALALLARLDDADLAALKNLDDEHPSAFNALTKVLRLSSEQLKSLRILIALTEPKEKAKRPDYRGIVWKLERAGLLPRA